MQEDKASYAGWAISAIVAAAGIAALVLMDFSAPPEGGAMITAAAVTRAGAIELPTAPPFARGR